MLTPQSTFCQKYSLIGALKSWQELACWIVWYRFVYTLYHVSKLYRFCVYSILKCVPALKIATMSASKKFQLMDTWEASTSQHPADINWELCILCQEQTADRITYFSFAIKKKRCWKGVPITCWKPDQVQRIEKVTENLSQGWTKWMTKDKVLKQL